MNTDSGAGNKHSETVTAQVARGSVIGPYRLIDEIGSGGFGMVFLAEQFDPIRRKVALKLIKPGMDSRDVLARFSIERQALALMDHQNIARVFDAGTSDSGQPYFVMEYVRGLPVTEYCDQHNLSVKDRLKIVIDICRAIQHAHQKGIIHRDLKPSNIIVTEEEGKPVAKVIDFGVAKATNQPLTVQTLHTGIHQLIGTPLYMSPEQTDPSVTDIDTRSDIYSLGVILYELLTGSTPIQRQQLAMATLDEVRRLVRDVEPPKPSMRLLDSKDTLVSIAANRDLEAKELPRLIRGELDWIVMKSLEKDRNRRYETANGLAREIERYLNDEPVEAGPPSLGYRLGKLARKHRGWITVASGFFLLLFGSTAISISLMLRATTAEAVANEQLIEVERERDQKDTAQKLAEKEKQAAIQSREEALIQKGKAEAAADRERLAKTEARTG